MSSVDGAYRGVAAQLEKLSSGAEAKKPTRTMRSRTATKSTDSE